MRKKPVDPAKAARRAARAASIAPHNRQGRTSRAGHATADEQRYMDRVAALGCILCRWLGFFGTPAQVHHPRVDLYGAGMRSSNYDVIPLCEPHHEGPQGVHAMGHDEFTKTYGKSEVELIAWVKQLAGCPV